MNTNAAHVTAGASLTGLRPPETLRAEGFDGPVVVIGEETQRPYERPLLSKDYLLGKAEREMICVHPQSSPRWEGKPFGVPLPVLADGPRRRSAAGLARRWRGPSRL